jgi:UDP:flavonoid glycosyltransferase YjiC (YdhE family)
MRIGIQTWGSTGDARPFIALAAGLQAAGHDVHLVLTDIEKRDYHRYADEYGYRYSQVATPVIPDHAAAIALLEKCLRAPTPIHEGRIIFEDTFMPAVDEIYRAATDLARDSDVVIAHHFLYPVRAAADIARKPYVAVAMAPFALPTRTINPARLPHLGDWFIPVWWWLLGKALNRMLLPYANDFRRRCGLPPQRDCLRDMMVSDRLTLVGASTALHPHAPDWPGHVRMCGFFDLPDAATTDTVSPEIEAFLAEGPPPIFITFGSLTPSHRERFLFNLAAFDEALARTGHRAILQRPLHDMTDMPSSPRILPVGFVSHRRVFPRCSAVIHHGGAGTTHAAAQAGVPAILVPHIADQFFWGERTFAAGISPRAIPMRQLSAGRLVEAIEAITPAMRERAIAVAAMMRNENGVANAIRAIEAMSFA